MLLMFMGLLEVSVKKSLKSLAVTSFVACHFMYHIAEGVKYVRPTSKKVVKLQKPEKNRPKSLD